MEDIPNKLTLFISIKTPPLDMSDFVNKLVTSSKIKEHVSHITNFKTMTTVHIINKKSLSYCSHGDPNILEWSFITVSDIIKDPEAYRFEICYPSYLPTPTDSIIIIPKITPLLLLDVDGVMNIVDFNNEALKTVSIPNGNTNFIIRYKPEIVVAVNELSKKVEIRWLTSWEHQARYRLAPIIGLNDFDVYHSSKYSLCRSGIMTVDELERPVIWIDDELKDKFGIGSVYTYILSGMKNKILPIAPDQTIGLTLEHIKQIEEFI